MKMCFALVVLAVMSCARPAVAFYTRGYFERSAALGGAGGLYYTGSSRERGWDCASCHEHSAGRVRITFDSDPPELIQTRLYTPGVRYQVTAVLESEHRGLEAQFNSNGFVAEVSRGAEKAGTLSEGPGTELAANGRIVLSRNDMNGLARWVFRWTAPPAGTGPVLVNLGAVDGDGAGRSDRSFQDHLNDDVFVGDLELREGGLALVPSAGDRKSALAAGPAPEAAERAPAEQAAVSNFGGAHGTTGGLLGIALALALALAHRARLRRG